MGTVSFPVVKCGRGVLLSTHTLLVQRSWKSRAIHSTHPLGHTGPVMGSLYLYITQVNISVVYKIIFHYSSTFLHHYICLSLNAQKANSEWCLMLDHPVFWYITTGYLRSASKTVSLPRVVNGITSSNNISFRLLNDAISQYILFIITKKNT